MSLGETEVNIEENCPFFWLGAYLDGVSRFELESLGVFIPWAFLE